MSLLGIRNCLVLSLIIAAIVAVSAPTASAASSATQQVRPEPCSMSFADTKYSGNGYIAFNSGQRAWRSCWAHYVSGPRLVQTVVVQSGTCYSIFMIDSAAQFCTFK